MKLHYERMEVQHFGLTVSQLLLLWLKAFTFGSYGPHFGLGEGVVC